MLGVCFIAGLAIAQETPTNQPKPSEAAEENKQDPQQLDPTQQMMKSLISLSETLRSRQERLSQLGRDLEAVEGETERSGLQAEIDLLSSEVQQAENEIEIVVLGLQSREYAEIGQEQIESENFDLGKEIGEIFQPLIVSLERATEPSRRMEELRQLLNRTKRREQVALNTLDHIWQFKFGDTEMPADVERRLENYEEIWQTRLQEAVDLGNALDEQLEAANNARGNTFTQFAEDFGNFVFNRGASLLLALSLGIGFLILCQMLRIALSNFYRARRTGILNAPVRVIGMVINLIGVIGALMIAIMIFNIRHDWLMLAMSLLLALAVSWSFVRALPTLLEEARVLLNLGSVREGERTVVNGIPYRIERLSVYSKLVNPVLNGGSLIFPVRELIAMHSRPVIADETWFPTDVGDWILRDKRPYEVVDQTPEHVILRHVSGAEDFVPVQEFLDTYFETLSNGYCRSHTIGLSYKHLDLALTEIPKILEKAVRKRVSTRVGAEALGDVEIRLIDLGTSSLDFKVMVNIGPENGRHWFAIQTDINNAVVESCLEQGWEIPFPQLVVHKG
jgi:hypothetical protein